jgi:hypothetical protein
VKRWREGRQKGRGRREGGKREGEKGERRREGSKKGGGEGGRRRERREGGGRGEHGILPSDTVMV